MPVSDEPAVKACSGLRLHADEAYKSMQWKMTISIVYVSKPLVIATIVQMHTRHVRSLTY